MTVPSWRYLLLEDVSVLLLEDVGDEHGLHDLLGVVRVSVAQHALHKRASHGEQQGDSLAHVLRSEADSEPTRTL